MRISPETNPPKRANSTNETITNSWQELSQKISLPQASIKMKLSTWVKHLQVKSRKILKKDRNNIALMKENREERGRTGQSKLVFI